MRAHLAGPDAGALTALLDHRPDLLVEPVPRDVGELAQRLNGADSLGRALREMSSDEVVTARVIALLGTASLATLARVATSGLGSDPAGLRKAELVGCLDEVVGDAAVVSRAVAGRPAPAWCHLEVLWQAGGHHYLGGSGRRACDPTTVLVLVLVLGNKDGNRSSRDVASCTGGG